MARQASNKICKTICAQNATHLYLADLAKHPEKFSWTLINPGAYLNSKDLKNLGAELCLAERNALIEGVFVLRGKLIMPNYYSKKALDILHVAFKLHGYESLHFVTRS